MLLKFSDVVPRSAVTSAEIDIIHVPRGVSSRQNCRDLSDSLGHVRTLLFLVTACCHGSWPYSYFFSIEFVVTKMMRNVRGVESKKARDTLVFVAMMMGNVRGVESNKIMQSFTECLCA